MRCRCPVHILAVNTGFQVAIIGFPPDGVRQGGIRFVDYSGGPVITPKVRVHPQALHHRAVACSYYFYRCISLHMENPVVVPTIFHALIMLIRRR